MSIKQDRGGVRTAQDLERKYDFSSLVSIKKNVELQQEGLNKTNATLEEFIDSTTTTIEDLKTKVDGNITTYFYNGIPTLDNMPAREWTETEYANHLGDLYYDNDTGKAYRFVLQDNTYLWLEIVDSDVAEALELASKAQDTADGKRRVFVTTPTVPYDVGDLWLKNQELYVCNVSKTTTQSYVESDFVIATKYTDNTALNNFITGDFSNEIKQINAQIDKKAETWYQGNDPSTSWNTAELKTAHVGDLWYNTSENKSYIYTSSNTWQEADGVPNEVYDKIDGKAQIFTTQPTTPYHEGDLYTQGSTGDIYVCKTERLTGSYTASDWQKASKYTDDTKAQQVLNELNSFVNVTFENAMENLTNQIDGKVTTWYYEGTPTLTNAPASAWTSADMLKHTGDLYYDKATGYTYIFVLNGTTYAWERIEDSDIIQSLALANAAQDTADGKRRVFVATPETPYDNGDLWVNNGEIYICQISKAADEEYVDGDFIVATKYTDDTYAKQVGDNLTVLKGTVLEVQKGVNEFRVQFDTTIKTIQNDTKETTEALETMSYSFGTKDLAIANSNDPVNARINNQGLKVYTYEKLETIVNHNGLGANKLIVIGDSQMANMRIMKAIDENGEACSDFHHLVSNIQTLEDLEV
jgi:phage-related protein